ncbi:hypothetical protein EN846_34015, partial [Mesorhizobium sp. M4B.F.Ca.ET.203.01.1.1]|uniref:hypothetical protein n=1 Tax=Mesorhizobium sp. M4B.F.Ca.ET.203.01.1.1 TaxID=2563953 RepID=UPI0010934FD4
ELFDLTPLDQAVLTFETNLVASALKEITAATKINVGAAAMDKRQIIEWDKDDIDIMKFMKMDCLALGMLSCMKRGFDMLEARTGEKYDLATVPQGDGPTYAMIQKADTLGTFQIE